MIYLVVYLTAKFCQHPHCRISHKVYGIFQPVLPLQPTNLPSRLQDRRLHCHKCQYNLVLNHNRLRALGQPLDVRSKAPRVTNTLGSQGFANYSRTKDFCHLQLSHSLFRAIISRNHIDLGQRWLVHQWRRERELLVGYAFLQKICKWSRNLTIRGKCKTQNHKCFQSVMLIEQTT